MAVRLRRPTADEYDAWSARALEEYIAEIVASGSLSRAAAEARARQQDAELLPQGLGTPGQLIFRIDVEDQPAGWLGSRCNTRAGMWAWDTFTTSSSTRLSGGVDTGA